MRPFEDSPFKLVLPSPACQRTQSEADAVDRRAAHEDAVLRRAQDVGFFTDAGFDCESQPREASAAGDEHLCALSKAEPEQRASWSQEIPIFIEESCDHAAKSGVVRRHYVYPDGERVRLPDRGHGLA